MQGAQCTRGARPTYRCHATRMRGIQYAAAYRFNH